MPFVAIWLDLEIIIVSKVGKKKKYHMVSLICEIQNTTQMNITTKWKQTHRPREHTCSCQGRVLGEGWGGKDWEFRISRCKLLYIGWINNKVIL